MDEHSHAIQTMAYPSIYNLLEDPKKEVPELNYLADTWVDFPLYQVLEDFQASLEKDPGTPDPDDKSDSGSGENSRSCPTGKFHVQLGASAANALGHRAGISPLSVTMKGFHSL